MPLRNNMKIRGFSIGFSLLIFLFFFRLVRGLNIFLIWISKESLPAAGSAAGGEGEEAVALPNAVSLSTTRLCWEYSVAPARLGPKNTLVSHFSIS